MKKWLGLLIGLGSIAAGLFVKNKRSQQIAGAAEQAAGVIVDQLDDDLPAKSSRPSVSHKIK